MFWLPGLIFAASTRKGRRRKLKSFFSKLPKRQRRKFKWINSLFHHEPFGLYLIFTIWRSIFEYKFLVFWIKISKAFWQRKLYSLKLLQNNKLQKLRLASTQSVSYALKHVNIKRWADNLFIENIIICFFVVLIYFS